MLGSRVGPCNDASESDGGLPLIKTWGTCLLPRFARLIKLWDPPGEGDTGGDSTRRSMTLSQQG